MVFFGSLHMLKPNEIQSCRSLKYFTSTIIFVFSRSGCSTQFQRFSITLKNQFYLICVQYVWNHYGVDQNFNNFDVINDGNVPGRKRNGKRRRNRLLNRKSEINKKTWKWKKKEVSFWRSTKKEKIAFAVSYKENTKESRRFVCNDKKVLQDKWSISEERTVVQAPQKSRYFRLWRTQFILDWCYKRQQHYG